MEQWDNRAMLSSYNIHALPWDLAIFLLIGGGIMLEWYALKRWRIARVATDAKISRCLLLALALFGQLLWLTIFYGSFIEPQVIVVTEAEITTLPLKEDLNIVILSHFHVGPYKGRHFIQRVVEQVNALEPDLVLLAGDYVYLESDPTEDLAPLKDLRARYGIFGVLGNHEYGCYRFSPLFRHSGIGEDRSLSVRRTLERVGVTVLRNEWREVLLEGRKGSESRKGKEVLYVSGVDDGCTARENLATALPGLERKAPIILLSHTPDIILDGRSHAANLIVSGHTHGGQIRVPFIGPVTNLPTQLGRKYDQGLFPVDANATLAITRGIGESSPRARLFAPPEILLLRAKREMQYH